MTDEELIARLRAVCTCNIDSTPCMAEDDCRDALAAALIADVPTRYQPVNGDRLLHESDVLAALSRALGPALTERAGEVLSRLRKADEYEPLGHDGWEAADLITALLAQNAALRAQIDTMIDADTVQKMLDSAQPIMAEACASHEEANRELEAERDALRVERDELAAQVSFTATDGQRLLRKSDVEGVCDDPDFCFDSEGSVARCGPCAVKIAARDGVTLNEYTRSNPQAMRLQRELSAAEAKVEKLRAEVDDAVIKRAAWELEAKTQKARAEAAEAEQERLEKHIEDTAKDTHKLLVAAEAKVEKLRGALDQAGKDLDEYVGGGYGDYCRAALAPTDAAHVNETPKSEHDGADVLTAAQARDAALREAHKAILEMDTFKDKDRSYNRAIHHAAAKIKAMIDNEQR